MNPISQLPDLPNFLHIEKANQRILSHLRPTPVLQWKNFYFKCENLQPMGAFKIRGALNTLLSFFECKNKYPKEVGAFSSGNHAQAVAYVASLLKIPCVLFMPSFASSVKIEGAKKLGAKIFLFSDRKEVEDKAQLWAKENPDCLLIPPYDHNDVIAGQGTAAYEAILQERKNNIYFDFICAPCGGGGLLSGTYLASKGLSPSTKIIGAEPLQANDAARSLRSPTGEICAYTSSPNTVADGARTLSLSPRTFHFIKQLDDFFEISEEDILSNMVILSKELHCFVEPTSAMGYVAAKKHIEKNPKDKDKNFLIILSGGNIDSSLLKMIAN